MTIEELGFHRPSLRGGNEKWEDLKALQSDFLKTIYPTWCGDYNGSIPAQLAEHMNLSYDCGYEKAGSDERQRIRAAVEKMKIPKDWNRGKDTDPRILNIIKRTPYATDSYNSYLDDILELLK